MQARDLAIARGDLPRERGERRQAVADEQGEQHEEQRDAGKDRGGRGESQLLRELAAHVVPPVPLDWCGAQTQGTLGMTILDALDVALPAVDADRRVAALVTRTLVRRDDPGFTHPTKPVGRYLDRDAAQLMIEHGQVWEDRGEKGWRRVVASPEPLAVLDVEAARTLLDAGYVVVAAGGGGIPVVREPDGRLRGVEAVIDKDLTAALLATALDCDVLVIATDVDHASVGFGSEGQRDLGRVSLAELRRLAEAGEFASGSMGPKVEAVIRFVATGGRRGVITSLAHITDALDGGYGTVVDPDPTG